MPWIRALSHHQSPIENFILPREHYCASLSARLRRAGDNRIHIPDVSQAHIFIEVSNWQNAAHAPSITSLYYIERSGFSFIICANRKRSAAELIPLRRLISPSLKKLFSCMGRAEDCETFGRMFGIEAKHKIDYFMMERLQEYQQKYQQKHKPKHKIHRGAVQDAEKLLPLHIAYEKEEVILPGYVLNSMFLSRQFHEILRRERLFFCEIDGRAVAKAQTNARGLGVEQIGGVYTVPSLRRRGIGTLLIDRLSREIMQDGKGAVLFVKRHNEAAVKLYEKCGFNVTCRFTIMYF